MISENNHINQSAATTRVAFHTLGCKLNFSETSSLARMVRDNGFEQVPFKESSDVYVINTCSVTDNADKKCRSVVRQALRTNPEGFVVVVGCYAQLKPAEISEIPGVDLVLGAAEKFQLPQILQDAANLVKKESGEYRCGEIEEVQSFVPSWSSDDRTRTFLKVQDGCDYNCAFCTIPLARGKSRSETIPNVISRVQSLAESGTREVVLTGINLGDFGWSAAAHERTREAGFLDLITALDKLDHVQRYRISSIEPNLLSDEIIRFVASSKRFVPHFHIPLQSGSDKILGLMRRRYRTALYRSRIALIRQLMPDAAIGVDVIVGFPGESHEDFLETVEFLKSLDVTYLHVFPYSERDNTLAVEMDAVVPKGERLERSQILRTLSEKLRRSFIQKFEGSTRTVLLEKAMKDGSATGFTDNYVRVKIPKAHSGGLTPGDFIPVQIGSALDNQTATANPLTNPITV